MEKDVKSTTKPENTEKSQQLTTLTLPIIIYSDNNCVENAIRNFLNHLLFNEADQMLDITRLPYLNPKLAEFLILDPINLTKGYYDYQNVIIEVYNDYRLEMIELAESIETLPNPQKMHLAQELAFSLSNPKASTIATAAFLAYIFIKDWLTKEKLLKFIEINEFGPPVDTKEHEYTPDSEVERYMEDCRPALDKAKFLDYFKDRAVPYFNEIMIEISSFLPKEFKFLKILTTIEFFDDFSYSESYVRPVFSLGEELLVLHICSRFKIKSSSKLPDKMGFFRVSGHAIFDKTTNNALIERAYNSETLKNDVSSFQEKDLFSVVVF